MKCPGCGYVSFDRLETCKRCGAPMSALSGVAPGTVTAPAAPQAGGPPARPPASGEEFVLDGPLLEPALAEPAPARRHLRGRSGRAGGGATPPGPVALPDDALELSEDDLAATGDPAGEADETPFHIDDDIFDFGETAAAPPAAGAEPAAAGCWQPFAVEPPEPAPGPSGQEWAGGGEPVIDRDEEIPERFWAPEIAGLGRRAAALLVDQAILALLLGLFFAAAYLALGVTGFDTDHLLSPDGLRASLAPFAMLAVVLSLAYQSFFHVSTGCTPGKALAGVEVRTADGAIPSPGRVLLRWLCAALGLAAAGLGVAWALIEPRRRGWADLLSGTVIARRSRGTAAEHPRR